MQITLIYTQVTKFFPIACNLVKLIHNAKVQQIPITSQLSIFPQLIVQSHTL